MGWDVSGQHKDNDVQVATKTFYSLLSSFLTITKNLLDSVKTTKSTFIYIDLDPSNINNLQIQVAHHNKHSLSELF